MRIGHVCGKLDGVCGQKMKTLDKILIIVGSFIAAFVVATVIIYTANGWQYDTLIPCVVGSGILETVNTMLITVHKIKRGKYDGIDNSIADTGLILGPDGSSDVDISLDDR